MTGAGEQWAEGLEEDEDGYLRIRPQLSNPPCYIYAFLTPLRFPDASQPDQHTGAERVERHCSFDAPEAWITDIHI